MFNKIKALEGRIKSLEGQINRSSYNTKKIVKSVIKKNWNIPVQTKTIFGFRLCLCVDTKDPQGEGRIRFFHPAMSELDDQVSALPWAKPISSLGGFDDAGSFFVPPAGSMVAITFENGDVAAPYYMGTVWTRTKGKAGRYWGKAVPEYDKYHRGKRTGYLVGRDDDLQNLPPSNTEFYNNYDFDTEVDFENDPTAKKRITIPSGGIIKTPQKHRIKMYDGHYDCNNRWKRMEMVSGDGNGIIFKDDHLHPFGQWMNPQCGGDGGDLSGCTDDEGNPIEKPECLDPSNQPTSSNQYYKRHEECIMADKIKLDQSGYAIFSRSGNLFIADDSVVEPTGKPGWERCMEPFNYGCQNIFQGKMFLQSAHGQLLELNDIEDAATVRGEKNRILLKSTTGNRIELNDHTTQGGVAGSKRGVTIESSSTHKLEMIDDENDQSVPIRKGGGIPVANSKKARVLLKSGYGLQFLMRDDNSQKSTQQQFIEIMAPQKDNARGPHILRFQERVGTEGLVYLRVGGIYYRTTTKHSLEMVGEEDYKPAFKYTKVKGSTVLDSDEMYVNLSDTAVIMAKKYALLGAGQDCVAEDGTLGPCWAPVLCVDKSGMVVMSDRVFVSCNQGSPVFSTQIVFNGIGGSGISIQ